VNRKLFNIIANLGPSSVLVGAWRWQWVASDDKESNICMQSSLASILIANDRSVQKSNMCVINQDPYNLIKISHDDIALCESLVRAEEWLKTNEKTEVDRILKKLQVHFFLYMFYNFHSCKPTIIFINSIKYCV
jgi:hypothetical protein